MRGRTRFVALSNTSLVEPGMWKSVDAAAEYSQNGRRGFQDLQDLR